MGDQWLLGPAATGKPERCIKLIAPLFAIIGFFWGYVLARRRGGRTLDRLQYGAGFAVAFGLFGILLGIALARFLGAA